MLKVANFFKGVKGLKSFEVLEFKKSFVRVFKTKKFIKSTHSTLGASKKEYISVAMLKP